MKSRCVSVSHSVDHFNFYLLQRYACHQLDSLAMKFPAGEEEGEGRDFRVCYSMNEFYKPPPLILLSVRPSVHQLVGVPACFPRPGLALFVHPSPIVRSWMFI